MTCTCEMIWAESARPPMRAMYRVDPRCQIHGTELDPRDAELASLRDEVSRLSALSVAHSQIADAWKARAARDAKTIGRISRLVGPPRCEACIREGRYTPCLECPEPGTPSGWVSGGGTSEVK